jgi:sterol desaturase/sphingolipid hydroxylase (fatty acid hydroxylase superfamily)
MLETPKKRSSVIALAIALYLTAPLVEWFYYRTELERGSFPVNADSIGLPLGMFMLGWFIGAPFAALIVWLILRSYPGRVSLFSFNGERPYWSIFWSVLFAVPVFYDFFFAVESIYRLQPLDVIQALLTVYLILCLRSSLIHNKLFRLSHPINSR